MFGLTQRAPLPLMLCGLMACLILPGAAHAQDDPSNPTASSSDFTLTDSNAGANNTLAPDSHADTNAGPVRLARFAFVSGNVSWRPDADAEWSKGSINLPLRQGAQLWVTDGGRAEVQFDDGSLLRLGNGAVVTLQTLYSDAEGEFTEIKLNSGVVMLEPRHAHSLYQVDTPVVSIKSVGPSRLRIGAGDGAEVAVRSGEATVEGPQGKATVRAGQYLDAPDATSNYDIAALPAEDSWDRWNDSRDRRLQDLANGESRRHLPANIDIVAGDLDAYGSWHDDPRYGYVWCPRDVGNGWRPYHDGHWTWVTPFGWTWVADEAWGWAPYHYGTWVNQPYGWAWCPGPVNQYWCPGVVHFSEYDGRVAWCPLAPGEIEYPATLSIGYHSGPWFTSFSIGACGVYYPSYGGFCYGTCWNTAYVNHVTYVNNTTIINNQYGPVNQTSYNHRFLPTNAQYGGASVTTVHGFGGHGNYNALPPSESSVFTQGHAPGAPPSGFYPASGPVGLRPTLTGLTPGRSYFSPNTASPASLTRPVFRSPLPPLVAQTNHRVQPGSNPSPIRTPNAGRTPGGPFGNRTGDVPQRGGGLATGNGAISTARPGSAPVYGRRSPATAPTVEHRPSVFPGGTGSAADAANNARASLGLPTVRRSPYGGTAATADGSSVPTYNRGTGSTPYGGYNRRSSDTSNYRSNTPTPGGGAYGSGNSSSTQSPYSRGARENHSGNPSQSTPSTQRNQDGTRPENSGATSSTGRYSDDRSHYPAPSAPGTQGSPASRPTYPSYRPTDGYRNMPSYPRTSPADGGRAYPGRSDTGASPRSYGGGGGYSGSNGYPAHVPSSGGSYSGGSSAPSRGSSGGYSGGSSSPSRTSESHSSPPARTPNPGSRSDDNSGSGGSGGRRGR